MDSLQHLSPYRIRDYLAKGWLTHDGMWFFNALNTLGIETANALNRAAIRSMASMEMQRTMAILGITPQDLGAFPDLADFMIRALDMVLPASILKHYHATMLPPNIFRWEWEPGECFAYKGIKLAGCIDRYSCGVIYRIGCWLDALGIEHRIEPNPDTCMMHEKGYCHGDIIVNLPG
ncbi:MAG: hypothetical protein KA369_10180 [Spirochaetes bacterium]|nr:hypothetical protein [Spirochaetota bacterium]